MKRTSKTFDVLKFVTSVSNDYIWSVTLLHEAIEALELCIAEDLQTFSSEQAAHKVLHRFQQGREY